MSFNLLIDSNNNINQLNQSPSNSLVIDPSLNYFYTFEPENLSGNLLLNQGISQAYDLTIDSGVVDGAFDGSPIGGTISSSLTLTSAGYSVGCWFKRREAVGSGIMFSFSSDNTNDNMLLFAIFAVGAGNFYIRDAISGSAINGSNNLIFSSVVLNRWYHVVYVNKGTTWDIYVDGAFYVSLSGKTPASGAVKTFNNIGRVGYASTNLFKGELDGLFVYNGQLTAAQILEIYQKGQKPTQTNYFYTIPIQPKTYSYANNRLQYYFDFTARPLHPYGSNKYKVYSSFISFGTPFTIIRTNQMSYYIVDGLGTFETFVGRGANPANTMPNNNLVKNITIKRSTNFVGTLYNQKFIDLDPTMPMIIQNLNETGIINVEIRLILNNTLNSNTSTFGAQATSYAIQLLFEPIP